MLLKICNYVLKISLNMLKNMPLKMLINAFIFKKVKKE